MRTHASRKVLCPLLAKGHHGVTRTPSNAVAYSPAPAPEQPRRGRPRKYGEKGRLRDLGRNSRQHFQSVPSPVYGEQGVTLCYYTIDLLRYRSIWRPIGPLVRFVLVEHPQRGRLILMSTDLTLTALELIACDGYRFKIELAFKQALHTVGTFAYHFWMMMMVPLTRRSGNQHLHRTCDDYRRLVRRKLEAYHRHAQLGCIAQGLLQ